MTARTPSSKVPFAAQSLDDPVPYSLPADHDQLDGVVRVLPGGVVDRHLLTAGDMTGKAALGSRGKKVA